MKFFNTAGPVNEKDHYCLPLSTRLNEQELRLLIEQKKYFILHAPRQTGKTSTILNWVKVLSAEGKYIALYVNVESGQAARESYKDALELIIQEFETRVREQLPGQVKLIEIFKELKSNAVPAGSLLVTLFSQLCAQSSKPFVIFIDEIDCLIGNALISVLRQLRSGYDKRPENFPQSVCLIGLRDVLGGSAFNIKAKDIFESAKETIIKRRDTHIDALIDKLQEPRIRNIIDAIITGNIKTADELKQDDIQYARDLGFIKLKGLEISNPIYQEVFPRELTYAKQEEMIQDIRWYQDPNGKFNMTKMLEAFTEFYRENAADWLADCKYKEAGPHLLMMAFLQRVINGGGRIHREYALGRKRLDLLLTWKTQKIVIELKVYKDTKTLSDGLEQTAMYMDIAGAQEGHLIIFDKRDKTWEEKIYNKQEIVGNKIITVWGL